MKKFNLKEVAIPKVKDGEKYLVVREGYERMGGGDLEGDIFTRKELIDLFVEEVLYGSDVNEDAEEEGTKMTEEQILKVADDCNGDGFDYYKIYKLPK